MFSIFPGRWRGELARERQALRELAAHGRLTLSDLTGPQSMTTVPRELVDRCLAQFRLAARSEELPEALETLKLVQSTRRQLGDALQALAAAAYANSTGPSFVVNASSWQGAAQAVLDKLKN